MSSVTTLDNTIGALLIGASVSTVLYGIFLVQVYHYYRRYPADKVGYKAIVAVLLLLLTTHQVLISHSVYYYSTTNFLDILVLFGKPIWSLVLQILIGAVVGTIVKFFFTLRVWRFSSGNIWLTAFLMLVTFGQLGLAVAFTAKGYELPALPDLANLRVLGIVALGVSVVNDMGTAIALCYYLQHMRTCYTQADTIIRSLTLYAVNTGALTSAMSFSTLIIYNFMPRNFVFVGCYFVLSKLYAVSFVAALNTRQTVRGQGTEAELKTSSISQVATNQRSRSFNIPLHSPTTVGHSTEAEPHVVEENGISSPGCSEDLEGQPKQVYAIGW